MESISPLKEARERLHRRALSQTSMTSTTHTQTTTKSTSSSSSHPRSTTPLYSPRKVRYSGSPYDRPPAAEMRPLPHLPSESSQGQKTSITPVSSLLQERLQQERKAEGERLASKLDHSFTSSTGATRDGDIPSPSSRRYRSTVERGPESSHGDDASQSSMGAKEVEKAVSTLHKQNFDLKLELFHRREKQTTLEARITQLESERSELSDIQDSLLDELVKRDKAVEEAVNMIVKLEARLDELAKETKNLRQTQSDGSYDRHYRHSSWNTSNPPRTETPRPDDRGALLSVEDKTLDRMPSFLSERSVHTENLRNLVLQNRSSLRHIRKISQVSSSSADVSEVNRVASPSLSMLSESSFLSIYGSKEGQDGLDSTPLEDVPGLDGTCIDRSPTPTKKNWMSSLPRQRSITYNHSLNVPSMASRPDQALTSNPLRWNSPLQKVENLGQRTNSMEETAMSTTSIRAANVVTPTSQSQESPSRPKGRSGKREAVLISYPTHKELANSHILPPTPDTVSSSVLRKHKNRTSSQDSLPSPEGARVPRVRTTLPDGSAYLRSLVNQEVRSEMNAHMALYSSPRNGTKHDQDLLLSDLGGLARSAAGMMTKRSRSDSFISDSDDSDGGADAHSDDTENCDYWMRESYKPERDKKGSSSHQKREGSPSPDLFSFPADSASWEPDAMFGTLKGGGFLSSPVEALKRDPIDEMASALQTPEPEQLDHSVGGAPPPSRRSSLTPHAAGQFLLSSLTGKAGRSSSRDGSVDVSGQMALPGSRVDTGPTTKRNQYPPLSGLHSRGRGLGLNMFFKRSGPELYGTPSSAMEPTFPPSGSHRGPPTPQAHLQHLIPRSGRNSVPPPPTMPWAARMHEDEYHSATPPPILRTRPPPLQTDLAGAGAADVDVLQTTEAKAGRATPSTGVRIIDDVAPVRPSTAQGGGGMRKWLGLGRKGSLKDRSG